MNKLFNEIVKRCNLRAISKKPQSWYLMGTVENDGLNKNNVKKILSDGDSINVQKSYFAQFVSEVAVEFEDKQFLTTFKRLQEFCNYNGLNREQYCAWLMLVAYQIFEEPEKLTVYNIKRICMMAWAFEALSTCAIMEDDLMDNETTRWKRECWHLKPEIGNTMITDVSLLRMGAFRTLKRYFRHEPYYKSLIGLLTDMSKSIGIGQTMDIEIQKKFKESRELDCYTLKKYYIMSSYKCYIPVVRTITIAILLLLDSQEEFYKYEYIFQKFGRHCQIENDVHDCFNNYKSFGRYGSDIREGKFSWPIAVALEHANKKQKTLIKSNYARPEPECQKVVMDVYKEIDIVQKFYDYKNKLLVELRDDFKKVSNPKIIDYIEFYINFYIDVDFDLENK